MRQGYSTSGGNDQGTWGVLPEETYDLSTTLSIWHGNHTMKTGASFTYDVTEQLFAPLQNGRYTFAGSPTVAPTPFQFSQAFALTPEARLMFPKAYVLAGFFQDDWRVRNNLTINLGLRYDVEIIKDIPDWPAGTDKNNLDPRVGFAWDPRGDQKWAVRGGFGGFTQQHAIFTIVKGGVGGRNGLVTLSLSRDRSAVPDVPEHAAGLPAGSGAAGAQHPGDFAGPRERARVDGEPRRPASAGRARQRGGGLQHQPRRQARVPRHERADADPEGSAQRGAERESQLPSSGRSAQADLTRPNRARPERLPPHGRAHQRRTLVVPRHPFLGRAPHHAAGR